MSHRNLHTRKPSYYRHAGDGRGWVDENGHDANARVRETVRLVDERGQIVVDGLARWFVDMFARGTDNS